MKKYEQVRLSQRGVCGPNPRGDIKKAVLAFETQGTLWKKGRNIVKTRGSGSLMRDCLLFMSETTLVKSLQHDFLRKS